MSIRALTDAKALKAIGEKMGRAGISERALEIAREIVADGSYKRAVEGIGQMKALSQACNFDGYWKEKRDIGFYRETHHLSLKEPRP